MTNWEKHRDSIMEIAETTVVHRHPICDNIIRPNMLKPMKHDCPYISCVTCHQLFAAWLMDEYKEPETDWSKVPVDTKIYVRDYEEDDWRPRHFAKYEDGEVHTWLYGTTSWDCSETVGWKYAKLAEDENESRG